MNPLNTLFKAASTGTLYMGATAVVAGGAAAAMHGNLEPLPLSLCFIFAVFAQLCINFCHRYNDERYDFGENQVDGIHFETASLTSLSMLKEATFGSLLMTGMLGLTIIAMGGWAMAGFGAVLTVLALLLNLGRKPLVRTPVGVAVTGFAYGPVATMAVCFLQSQRESANDFNWYDLGPAIYLGLAAGFMVANWKIIHNYAHYDADKRLNKRTMTVAVGLTTSRVLIVINALCAFFFIYELCRVCSPNGWLWLVAMPGIGVLAYTLIAVSLKKANHQRIHLLGNIAGLTMLCVMLAIFIIICFTGIPFDTNLILW